MSTIAETTGALSVLGEPTRVRLLALLAKTELAVADLVAITELGQSRVSMHLAKLKEGGFLRDRRAGPSTFYVVSDAMPDQARKLWGLVSGQLDDSIVAADRARCDALLAARRGTSFPDALAGQMERHYSPGRTWESLVRGVVGLLDLGDVLDIGCGDGAVAEMLAPRARSYTGIDASPKMVDAATKRLDRSVKLVIGDMHQLPFKKAAFDQVLLFNVLVHAEKPQVAIDEVARVLRPGGRAAIVTLDEHDQEAITREYHHAHPGFSVPRIRKMLGKAGLEPVSSTVSRERRPPQLRVVTLFAQK